MRGAAERGDVDALYQLALWHLIGAPVPRDLPAARSWLRRAVEIGHVDAALMEIALTANGSGGAADWPRALALLEVAAADDPLAADQLRLVRAMRIDTQGLPLDPPVGRPLSSAPDVRLFPALFTADECLHVARTADPLLEPARVIDPRTGRAIPHPVRAADDGVIGPAREDLAVRALNARIAAASGTRVEQGEPLTVLRYAPGQQYRAHHDAIAHSPNQRGWTMLVYLNEGYGGGETMFLANGLRVRGRLGDGLLFRNTDAAGTPDPRATHAGMPVTAGHKWLCSRWIRLGPHDPWTAG
ncbi:MAG: proline hydroxylase [Sphingomonas sp.]|nr:MAG: proline hydroxylase [Sphingomonas sp.]